MEALMTLAADPAVWAALITLMARKGSKTVTGPRDKLIFSARILPSCAHSSALVRINVTCGLCR